MTQNLIGPTLWRYVNTLRGKFQMISLVILLKFMMFEAPQVMWNVNISFRVNLTHGCEGDCGSISIARLFGHRNVEFIEIILVFSLILSLSKQVKKHFLCLNLLILIGSWLLYNVVLVSAIFQHESVTGIQCTCSS